QRESKSAMTPARLPICRRSSPPASTIAIDMKARYATARITHGQTERATVRDSWDEGAAIHSSQIGMGSRLAIWKSWSGFIGASHREDRSDSAARTEIGHALVDLG